MTSIIIPIRNAGEQVCELLTRLKEQTVPGEVIIVDSSSSDAADSLGSSGVRVIKIRREDFDHGGTRTMAAEEARGDILVFLSQDVLPFGERSIENLVRPFEDETVGAAYGRQVPYPDASPFAAHLRLFNYPETSCLRSIRDKKNFKIKTPFLSNAFSAYRKKALLQVGGFKGRLIFGEDTYAGAKLLLAGYKIAYTADAMVYHSHNYTPFEEFKRYFDIGVFHRTEAWILEEFGRAEGEGMAYVRSAAEYLIHEGRYLLLPELAIRTALKFTGYNLGRKHQKLPLSLIKKMSMHKDWWKRDNIVRGKGIPGGSSSSS
jgi:rhamnosyltransferase